MKCYIVMPYHDGILYMNGKEWCQNVESIGVLSGIYHFIRYYRKYTDVGILFSWK